MSVLHIYLTPRTILTCPNVARYYQQVPPDCGHWLPALLLMWLPYCPSVTSMLRHYLVIRFRHIPAAEFASHVFPAGWLTNWICVHTHSLGDKHYFRYILDILGMDACVLKWPVLYQWSSTDLPPCLGGKYIK